MDFSQWFAKLSLASYSEVTWVLQQRTLMTHVHRLLSSAQGIVPSWPPELFQVRPFYIQRVAGPLPAHWQTLTAGLVPVNGQFMISWQLPAEMQPTILKVDTFFHEVIWWCREKKCSHGYNKLVFSIGKAIAHHKPPIQPWNKFTNQSWVTDFSHTFLPLSRFYFSRAFISNFSLLFYHQMYFNHLRRFFFL